MKPILSAAIIGPSLASMSQQHPGNQMLAGSLQIRFNGGMRNIHACLYVRPSDQTTLERLVADGKTPQKIVARARIVLLSGCGLGTNPPLPPAIR